ncbi:MAG: gamma-glutamyltransferase [Candidatus Aminicenantes bacterium]|nr:MAG: gamma-glutamyltransferase [Candidatus Aminicenantes bacterium]
MTRRDLFLIPLFIFLVSCQPQTLKVLEPPADHHQPYDYIGKKGMVVAAHPEAVKAGLNTLKRGGNAVDAAIATAFALNAAEPFASGIGGGGFMIIFLAEEKKATVINFRERAPAKAFPSMYLDKDNVQDIWRKSHGLAVAVPGALAGWVYALKKYGTMNLKNVLESGIQIAEQGIPVSPTFSQINKDEYEKILQNSGESSSYLHDGFPYEPDDIYRNPELAQTLKRLISHGWQDFYDGQIAQGIVQAVQRNGGIMSLEDLAQYSPIEQSPLRGTYKDYTIYTVRPPSSGGLHILQLLNIIAHWPVREWGFNSTLYIHHLSEAFRFIFADKARFLGDPDFTVIPVKQLLSEDYASQITSRIHPGHLQASYPYGRFDKNQIEKENTTHLGVIDSQGNIVSLTQSINDFFGSGIVPEGYGFLLNNEMADFSPYPDSVNSPSPYKRPVSSMGPLILFKKDMPLLVLGSPGGTRIFTSLTQIIINVIEFGMSLDEAIEAPRFFTYSSEGVAKRLFVESRIPQHILQSLEEIGHMIEVREAYDKYFGGAQGILIDRNKNVLYGGADSRRDGSGAGY